MRKSGCKGIICQINFPKVTGRVVNKFEKPLVGKTTKGFLMPWFS